MRSPLIGSHRSGQRVAWLNAEEASAVLSAYVLIETEVGKVAHVAQALSDLDGVQLVVSRIQVVDGVTRTLTCMVIQR